MCLSACRPCDETGISGESCGGNPFASGGCRQRRTADTLYSLGLSDQFQDQRPRHPARVPGESIMKERGFMNQEAEQFALIFACLSQNVLAALEPVPLLFLHQPLPCLNGDSLFRRALRVQEESEHWMIDI